MHQPLRASGTHLSLIAHITQHELTQSFQHHQAHNGFANRCLWTWVERSNCLPDGGSAPAEELSAIAGTLRSAVAWATARPEILFLRDHEALSSFGQIVMSTQLSSIPACEAQPPAVARPRSFASAPSMPPSTRAKCLPPPPPRSLRRMDLLLRSAVRLFGPGHRRPHRRPHSRGRRSLPQRPLQESDQSSLLWPRR